MNTCKQYFPITAQVYSKVREFIGMHPAERGIMIGRLSDGVISSYEADVTGSCDAGAYDPDIRHMNIVIKKWKAQGIEFIGFIHSHPSGIRHPSGTDREYAGDILSCFKKLTMMWMPIVQTISDTGKFELIPYAAIPYPHDRKKCKIVECQLKIIGMTKEISCAARVTIPFYNQKQQHEIYDKSANRKNVNPMLQITEKSVCTNNQIVAQSVKHTSPTAGYNNNSMPKSDWFGVQQEAGKMHNFTQSGFSPFLDQVMAHEIKTVWEQSKMLHSKYFQRLAAHYDLEYMDKTRLIIIGTGGASSLVSNCARMGFGEYVLIDPDIISESNIGTQDAMPSVIGKTKVGALAKDIVEINPRASVAAFPVKIEDFSDANFDSILSNPMRWDISKNLNSNVLTNSVKRVYFNKAIKPEKTVLLVLTDNFEAQARGHRLGLHFGIPTICAAEYAEGIGAEVTYTVPGITPACHRCITASRYKAYLEEGFKNNVTSAGAPVFAAEFLNAVLGHMLLAVVYHGTTHSRWGHVIKELGNRNLLKIRMDNSYDKKFGSTVFGERLVPAEGSTDVSIIHSLDTVFRPQTPDSGQSISRPVCPDCGGKGNLSLLKGNMGNTRNMRK